MRTLVAAVGYRYLRDHSAAFAVIDRLEREGLGADADVAIEDASYNPIAFVQWLQDDMNDPFDRAIFVAAVERAGRPSGRVVAYRWDGKLPSDLLVQQAVADAVTGVISVDNTIVVAGHFSALPTAVAVVEIEPRDHEFGTAFSSEVAIAIDRAAGIVRALATDQAAFDVLAEAGLPAAPVYRVHSQ